MKRPVIVLLSLAIASIATGGTATPAGAQEADEERNVEITFDVGDFDAEQGDWPVTVVYVAGDVEEGEPFTVELRGDDGDLLWSGTDEFDGSVTALAVDEFVAVGDVDEAGISQALPAVESDVIEREPAEVLSQGAGGGGGGTLALSMVLAVILVAIVFRTPLPSASTQRWTK